jgi:hypothetical protein
VAVVEVPSEVRHYYRAARRPFLNLSDVPADEVGAVVRALMEEQFSGQHRRAFGRRYMELRRRTESKMRELFVEAGGQPERASPHYFVLGESKWFGGLADDMRSVVLRLDELPHATTSITYPDSFTAMALAPEYGLPYDARPYHDQVFRLNELEPLLDTWGLPAEPIGGYEDYESRPFEMYVEIQVWSDDPVMPFLRPGAS